MGIFLLKFLIIQKQVEQRTALYKKYRLSAYILSRIDLAELFLSRSQNCPYTRLRQTRLISFVQNTQHPVLSPLSRVRKAWQSPRFGTKLACKNELSGGALADCPSTNTSHYFEICLVIRVKEDFLNSDRYHVQSHFHVSFIFEYVKYV